jgi:hypothetical protein
MNPSLAGFQHFEAGWTLLSGVRAWFAGPNPYLYIYEGFYNDIEQGQGLVGGW